MNKHMKKNDRANPERGGGPQGFVAVYRSPDPFPPKAYRYMTYAQRFLLLSDTTIGNLGAENSLRLNSIFDPDATGGTHQPYGFDTMALIYNRYVVHGVDLEVVIQNGAGNQVSACALMVRPSSITTSLTGTSVTDVWERPQSDVLFPMPTGDTVTHRSHWKIWDIDGVSREQLLSNVEEYSALMTLNPTRMPTLGLAVANMSSTSQITLQVTVRFRYHVEFFERLTQGISS